jgi:hypothetical protein
MAEIEFADGTRVVDDIYVEPINEVTEGSPQRYPFGEVMKRIGNFVERDILRNAQRTAIREHFRQPWGS